MFLQLCLTAWRKIAHICVSDAVTTVCVFVQSELSPENAGFKGRSLRKKELPLQAGGPGGCRTWLSEVIHTGAPSGVP